MAARSSEAFQKAIDEIAARCIAVRLRRLNRAVTNLYDDALRRHGVRVSQLNILVAAVRMGEPRPADVCRVLELDPSTLSRNLERMRKRGWVETRADSRDARSAPFRVTRKGKTLIERAHPAWREAQARAETLIGAETAAVIDVASIAVRGRG